MMSDIELIATSSFGLEAVVKREVEALGYKITRVENGKVHFAADTSAIPVANLWLRAADRILVRLGEFRTGSFERLFECTRSLPWDEWITEDGKFTVTGKSVKSKLHSVPDCQSIVKKAVVEKLKTKYGTSWFKEDGPSFTILVSLLKDVATLTIDSSGAGLHKRGYRKMAVEAPLKETLAAAIVQLSFWKTGRLLFDPFCGSGTIPIEAAMIGMNMAPGLKRTFASESWPRIGPDIWKTAREKALSDIDSQAAPAIYASDRDSNAVKIAKENAVRARVEGSIQFLVKDFHDFSFDENYGLLVCNPPYGERVGERVEVERLYRDMGNRLRKLKTWSVYILASHDRFEYLYGKKADRKRKLYNGRIKTNFYQFYGVKPSARQP